MPRISIPPIEQPLSTRELRIAPYVLITVGILLIIFGVSTL